MKRTGKLWRRVSACVLAVSMLCSMAVPASAEAESSRRGNVNYVSNQGELLETPLVQLPLGAVKARDWLENQLLLQKDNLTGNMKKFNNYNYETSEWLNHQSGDNWEKGTYFFRGLVALAYALDDAELKEEAQQWVEAILSSQTESGAFGPTSSLGNWWSRMPALMGMRDYYEATVHQGNPDERVLPFFEKYYRYQAKELPNRPLSDWGDARGGDNLECVFSFYNQVYDPADPEASQWLLDLGTLLYEQTWDWQDKCNNTTIREHVVNTTQGIKAPPVYYQLSGDEADKVAYRNGIFNYSVDHGRIDNQPNADERARDNRSTRGNETCSVVEGLLTAEISERIFGDVWTANRNHFDLIGPCIHQTDIVVLAGIKTEVSGDQSIQVFNGRRSGRKIDLLRIFSVNDDASRSLAANFQGIVARCGYHNIVKFLISGSMDCNFLRIHIRCLYDCIGRFSDFGEVGNTQAAASIGNQLDILDQAFIVWGRAKGLRAGDITVQRPRRDDLAFPF